MRFFDCNASYGTPFVPALRQIRTAEELIREMDFCGIDRALVRHAAIEQESPVVGNKLVLSEIKGRKRLEAAWGILPPQTGELGGPDEFVASMKRRGVRALWAFPDRHRYLLNGVTFGPLFEIMIQRGIPLFLQANWPLIDGLLAEFPALTVIAVGHGCWGDDRFFRPLVEKYASFHVDTSRYELDGGIADFVGRYGPERMLFGSHLPFNNAGGPILTLLHAAIPAAAKEAIAAGNLDRILREVTL